MDEPEKMPPPVVSLNREPDCAEVSYFMPAGFRLDEIGHEKADLVFRVGGDRQAVATPSAGFGVVRTTAGEPIKNCLRGVVYDHAVPDDRLPTAPPRVVCGVCLDAIEAGLFERAVHAGKLVIGRDMPCGSPVPEAWRRWCSEQGLPHAVEEEK